MLKFSPKYFALTVLLFIVETGIAIFVHDTLVRPYFGDFFVVILIYCFLKSFVDLSVWKAALYVLLFSFGIEFLQYLNLVEKLGLDKSKITKTILGSSFSWIDIFTYFAGLLCVLLIETSFNKRK